MMQSAVLKMQDKLQKNLAKVSALKKVGGGSRFFGTNKKGEAVELQADLNSTDKDRQKNALKRIIANMTLGRDVSSLFTDVVKLGQTTNLELKKLVYLYVLNTAKLQPDKALMAVNTFLQDDHHQSPIVRALALRTMLCIRVECVTEYTLEPLRRAMTDKDPYVRKTAAIGVGKLFHQNPRLFEEQGFVDSLVDLLSDSVPIVQSNAAIVLCEIRSFSTVPIKLEPPRVNGNRLLNAIQESTEWGQLYLLELLSHYIPTGSEEAQQVIERCAPRLSSVNPAVSLAAVKVLATNYVRFPDISREQHFGRVNSAVLSLTKSDHQTQYTVLRNIHFLLEIFPGLMASNIESFFIRFNDPVYLKLEKIKLILRLMQSSTASHVVQELTEYSQEYEPTFLRQIVSAIATAAIKCDNVAPSCVSLLLDVAKRHSVLLPEIITATKNIVRKYPDLFIDLLPPLINDHGADSVDDEEAKKSFIWMLGEFCDVVEDGQQHVRNFIDTFVDQETSVQLATVTAVVKIFLRNPAQMEGTLNHVLQLATEHSTDPDLRDRAWMYWRLLSKGIGVAKMKQIVHGRKAPIEAETSLGNTMTQGEMIHCVNTVSAVYGRLPRTFLPSYGTIEANDDDESDYGDDEPATDSADAAKPPTAPTPTAVAPTPTTTTLPTGTTTATTNPTPPVVKHADPLGDIFAPATNPTPTAVNKPVDPFASLATPTPAATTTAPAPAPAPTKPADPFGDLFGGGPAASTTNAPGSTTTTTGAAPAIDTSLAQVVDSNAGNGLAINAGLDLSNEVSPALKLVFHNRGGAPINGFALQLNKSVFSFVPSKGLTEVWPDSSGAVAPGQSVQVILPIQARETHFDGSRLQVQVAVKSSAGMAAFFISPEKDQFFLPTAPMQPAEFAAQWKSMDPSAELSRQVPGQVISACARDKGKFMANLTALKFQVVVQRDVVKNGENTAMFYGVIKMHNSLNMLFELSCSLENNVIAMEPNGSLTIKNPRAAEFSGLVMQVLAMAA